MLFVILTFCVFFACLPLCACQSDINGSILYDHAKCVTLVVRVKIESGPPKGGQGVQ